LSLFYTFVYKGFAFFISKLLFIKKYITYV
jgi:hypothetical protein